MHFSGGCQFGQRALAILPRIGFLIWCRVSGSIPAVANFVVFTNDYLGQVDVPLLTFPETSIAIEARAIA